MHRGSLRGRFRIAAVRPATTNVGRGRTIRHHRPTAAPSGGNDFDRHHHHHHHRWNFTAVRSIVVRIGHVEREVASPPVPPSSSDRPPPWIPRGYLLRLGMNAPEDAAASSDRPRRRPSSPSPRAVPLRHLQWMMAKDSLRQDVLLVGADGGGAVLRRRLALAYAELAGRPVEVLTLSADTTEGDLKQRRELSGEGGAVRVTFRDQAPVRAALEGRILILDGLQRVERNVLPALNNLLENREMHLEDGRLLVSAERHDKLLSSSGGGGGGGSFLVPTHPDFRVVALLSLGEDARRQRHHAILDPPVRSRFQIRRVDNPTADDVYEAVSQRIVGGYPGRGENEPAVARRMALFAAAMEAAAATEGGGRGAPLSYPATTAAAPAARILQTFPRESAGAVLSRAYPYAATEARLAKAVGTLSGGPFESSRRAFLRVCDELGISSSTQEPAYEIESISPVTGDPFHVKVHFKCALPESGTSSLSTLWGRQEEGRVIVRVPSGGKLMEKEETSPPLPGTVNSFVPTDASAVVLVGMMQEHFAGRDMLLVSPKGEGKSVVARQFAGCLGYSVHVMHLFREMTALDLLARRGTDAVTGETVWTESPLVQAARTGQICLLDGIEKLRPDTLGTLQRLLTDREVCLPDGTTLALAPSRQDGSSSSSSTNVIHPSFRVIGLASISSDHSPSFLTEEVVSMFSTISLPAPGRTCLKEILSPSNAYSEGDLDNILDFHETLLSNDTASECGVSPLSIRTLLRLLKRGSVGADVHESICSALLADLLPPTQRASLESVLKGCGIKSKRATSRPKRGTEATEIKVSTESISIEDFTMERKRPRHAELVPSPHFFDIPSHVQMIKTLLGEWTVGERSFLLLGNQGTGKNKICDRICELAGFEREYLQLHRDSTIGQLTLSPSIEDGKIVWRDSPLVRAVTEGRALVIDEADKAPLEVVSVLKSLVEDGELLLADGRRILRDSTNSDKDVIPIHPDFTVWVLANRPGRLFHGNDFNSEIGDCFSTHVVPNPDLESEIRLLQSYAPNIDSSLLRRIAASFDELRGLFEKGDITYPYSTREAVAVATHLERFPDDHVVAVLHNVLDLDSFDAALYRTLGEVFRTHGFDFHSYQEWTSVLNQSGQGGDLKIEYQADRSTEGTSKPPPLSMPKIGKWDDNNDPHVGGNQWQGGTGGSDTAGLGGRGGPYRLDRGHKVHQVSDEAKAQVSEEAKAAARRIAEKALNERLQEIGMSKSEYQTYHSFLTPVKADISNLRATLQSVEYKTSHRDWIKRQTHGEIDDSKLIDGIAGEKHIYKRRGDVDPEASKSLEKKPRRLRFVVDCSGSMYRFNGYDDRLNRCLQAAALVMESFEGLEEKFDYSIVGHSGDSHCIELVKFADPPANAKERMRILQTMVAHSQFCQSGDNTLRAIKQAVIDVSADSGEHAEESVVIAISDANLRRYGIHPRELGRAMNAPGGSSKTKAFCIFIASFGDEADEIKKELPLGRGFVCMHTNELPTIVRNILTQEIA